MTSSLFPWRVPNLAGCCQFPVLRDSGLMVDSPLSWRQSKATLQCFPTFKHVEHSWSFKLPCSRVRVQRLYHFHENITRSIRKSSTWVTVIEFNSEKPESGNYYLKNSVVFAPIFFCRVVLAESWRNCLRGGLVRCASGPGVCLCRVRLARRAAISRALNAQCSLKCYIF